MFMNIEGGEAQKLFEHATKEREEAAAKLWDISCCRQNVFNKTSFMQA
jgi:hypothetical protein